MTSSGPSPAAAARLDHAGLVVTDLDAAVAFFRSELGATELFRLDRFVDASGRAAARLGAPPSASFALVMLELDGGRLELVRWWHDAQQDAPTTAVGSGHLALDVPDVGEAIDRLCGRYGAVLVGEPVTFAEGPTPGLSNAFVRLPWGMLVELMHYRGTRNTT